MKIFSGSANPALARKIAEYLGVSLGAVRLSRFPDGEVAVKVEDHVRGDDVFVVQPTCSPPNENLMELLILIDALRRASAARVTAVMPFYGYARQDRKDQPRVPITAKLVANLLVASGVNRVLTLDLHAQQIQGFFDIPLDHLYASPVIVGYLKEKRLPNPVVVSPDTGGLKMAHAYAQMLDAGLAIVAKERRGPAEVEAFSLVGDVKGKTAILVDDLATTAGTLCAAAEFVRKHGATATYAAVTHAVLVPAGIERLRRSGITEIVVTDSVPVPEGTGLPLTVRSVAGLLGEAIRRINEDKSISDLFHIERESRRQ